MTKKQPPITALKAFESVARHNSFKGAAHELSITSSAISHHIKALETAVGVSLFDRRKPSILLSPAGLLLKDGLIKGFGEINHALAQLAAFEQVNSLSIAADGAFSQQWLAPKLSGFLETNDAMSLTLTNTYNSASPLPPSSDVTIDLMPNARAMDNSELLAHEYLVVVAAPQYVSNLALHSSAALLNATRLVETSLLSYSPAYSWEGWHQRFDGNTTTFSDRHKGPTMHFGNDAAQAISTAKSGGGVLLTRLSLVQQEIENGTLVIPMGPVVKTQMQYGVCIKPDKQEHEPVQDFITWLKHRFFEQEAWLDDVLRTVSCVSV